MMEFSAVIPSTEQDCVAAKVAGGLAGTDLNAKKLTDLSAGGRIALAQATDGCLSATSMNSVFEKVVGSQIGLSPPAAACLANAVAAKVKYTALVKQERPAVEAVAKAARKCAAAK